MRGMRFLSKEQQAVFRYGAWAALAAVALAPLHVVYSESGPTLLFLKSILHSASMAGDPIIEAVRGASYTFVPRLIAAAVAWMGGTLGVAPETLLESLHLSVWIVAALLQFRWVYRATGDRDVAGLATLLFGLAVPFGPTDAPYSLTGFERTLGLIPLFLSLGALVRGERWKAWAGAGAAIYVHANPALWLWPILLMEDGLDALRHPKARRQMALRAAATLVLAIPLILMEGGRPISPDYVRVSILDFRYIMDGIGLSLADWIFMFEGLALIGLAALCTRDLPNGGIWIRAIVLSIVAIIVGSAAYQILEGPFAQFLFRLQPWVSYYLVEISGQVLVSLWLVQAVRKGEPVWPAVLWALVCSYRHDFILRLGAVLWMICAVRGWRKAGWVVTAGACLLPIVYWNAPEVFLGMLHSLGFRGGMLELPAFTLMSAFVLAVGSAAGVWLHKIKKPPRPALFILVLFIFAAGIWGRPLPPENQALSSLLEWARVHTEKDAVLILRSMHTTDCQSAMLKAERSVAHCRIYLRGGMNFGPASTTMHAWLKAMGFRFEGIEHPPQLDAESKRFESEFNPAAAAAYAGGRPAYLLDVVPGVYNGALVHQEGSYRLYRIP